MSQVLKPLRFWGPSKQELTAFPKKATGRAGYALELVQKGEDPPDAKPLSSVGSGVFEIRVRAEGDTFRVLYVAKFEEAVYVLHAFKKKSKQGISTPKQNIETARARYKELVAYRGRGQPYR